MLNFPVDIVLISYLNFALVAFNVFFVFQTKDQKRGAYSKCKFFLFIFYQILKIVGVR
jgi:hypothetical protein